MDQPVDGPAFSNDILSWSDFDCELTHAAATDRYWYQRDIYGMLQ